MNRVIFWDFDGTLVYGNTSFRDSLALALQEGHYQIPVERIGAFLKQASSWYHPEIAYPDATGERWWETLLEKVRAFCAEENVAPEDIPTVCRVFREQVTYFPYQLYEDARETLTFCQALGYRNFLISNNFPELVQTVERFGLSRYLEDCILSADVGYEKPREEIFQIAYERAGCPQICYMVGDNPVADIQGAHRADMRPVLVHRELADLIPGVKTCKTLREAQTIFAAAAGCAV